MSHNDKVIVTDKFGAASLGTVVAVSTTTVTVAFGTRLAVVPRSACAVSRFW